MVLAARKIDLPFEHGMEQSVDKRLLPAGMFRRAVNVYYDKQGRPVKRNGYAVETLEDTTGATITDTPVAVSELVNERAFVAGSKLYSKSNKVTKYQLRGYLPASTDFDKRSIRKYPDAGAKHLSVAIHNGYRVCAWIQTDNPAVGALDFTGDLWAAVYDEATGALIFEEKIEAVPGANTTGPCCPKVVGCGNYVYVFYARVENAGPPHSVWARRFDTTDTTPTAFAAGTQNYGTVNAITLVWGRSCYDVDSVGSNLYLVKTNAGGASIDVRWYDSEGVQQAAQNIVKPVDVWVAIRATGNWVWVGLSDSVNFTYYYVLDTSLGAVNGPYSLDAGTARYPLVIEQDPVTSSLAHFLMGWQTTPAAPVPANAYLKTSHKTGTSTGTVTGYMGAWHYWPASRPFAVGNNVYAFLFYYSVELQQHYALVQLQTTLNGSALPMAWIARGQATADHGESPLPQPVRLVSAATSRYVAALSHEFNRKSFSEVLQEAVTYEFALADPSRRLLQAQAHGAPVYTGGMLSGYDGGLPHEIGYGYAPDRSFCKIQDSATAGSLVATSTYQWCFVYEWYDRLGRRHLSQPSIPIQVTLGAGKTSVDMRIQSLSLTLRDNEDPVTAAATGQSLRILIFRTEASGTVFRLVTSSTMRSPVNDPTTHSVTANDGLSDASLTDGTHEILYCQGTLQPNEPPGPCSHVALHKNRLFICTENRVRYSKVLRDGLAPEFTVNNQLTIGSARIVALASMDDYLVAFTEDGYHRIDGEGPDDNGNGYFVVNAITSDAGCVDARSLCTFRDGVLFRSKNTLELLPRGGGAPMPLGETVADEIASYPTVTSAVVVPAKNQLRVTLSNGAGAGATLCWDLTFRKWSVYEIDGPRDHVTAGLWGDTYVAIQSAAAGGRVLTETALYIDPGSAGGTPAKWIPQTLELGDLRFAGINGVQRLWETQWLGEFRGDALVNLFVAYNGSPTYTLHGTWDIYGQTVGDEVAKSHPNRKQQSRAVRYKFVDAPRSTFTALVEGGGDPGAGVIGNGISLLVGVDPKLWRSPTNARSS